MPWFNLFKTPPANQPAPVPLDNPNGLAVLASARSGVVGGHSAASVCLGSSNSKIST